MTNTPASRPTKHVPDLHEIASFSAVGGAGFLVDVSAFNLLHAALGPEVAKLLAVVAAMVITFLGSSLVTWRDRGGGSAGRRMVLFVLFNVIGLSFSEVALLISHAIGFDGRLADNVAANVIGLGAGTAFRFWSYRTWVFKRPDSPVQTAPSRHRTLPRISDVRSVIVIPTYNDAATIGRCSTRSLNSGQTAD